MPNLGPTELIIILLIVILLFGARKIPEIAKGLGKGIRDFKGALKEGEGDGESTGKKPADTQDATQPVQKSDDSGSRPSA